MRIYAAQRLEVFGTMFATVVAVALVATPTGRDALAWVYLQSIQAIEHSIHLPFPLDRLDPTCSECM
ncbi:MAG TPA: hypothetical protein VGG18_11800 [Granulicella sp.]|jgi:hypothetical protein